MNNNLLQLISDELTVRVKSFSPQNFNLLSGSLSGEHGLTIAYFHLLRLAQADHSEEPYDFYQHSFQAEKISYKNRTFGNGLAGYCWTLEYLQRHNFVVNADAILSPLDSTLEAEFYVQLNKANFDLIKGANGLMLYFLSRKNYDGLESLTANYLLKLRQFSVLENEHPKWQSMSKNAQGIPERTNNLGIPHGMTGILALLLRLRKRSSLHVQEIDSLIKDVVKSLLAEELPESEQGRFPSLTYPQRKACVGSHLGWCYGDLAIGYTFLKAAKITSDPDLERYAINLLTSTVLRTDCINMNNLTLCHGLVSISYIFFKIFALCQDHTFEKASLSWLNSAEVAFIRNRSATSNESFLSNNSILYGIPGIFIAALSMQGYVKSDWDESMLL